MPWNHLNSPLDHTLDSLDRLTRVMRREFDSGLPITAQEYFDVIQVLERLTKELRPLQEMKIQEQK